jgi:hypothetical protein
MLNESPRLLFMDFWANHDAVRLATDLHTALARYEFKEELRVPSPQGWIRGIRVPIAFQAVPPSRALNYRTRMPRI